MEEDIDISDREAVFIAVGMMTAAILPLDEIASYEEKSGEYGPALNEINKTCKKVISVIESGLKKTKKLLAKKE